MREGVSATVHSRRLKHTSSLPKYHFTVQSSPVKDGHVDPHHEGNFGGPLRQEHGRNRHARANKVHERGHNLRLSDKGSPNARCCFSGGGSNICLGDSNWRKRHSSCPFHSGGLSPDGGCPCPAHGGHRTNRMKLIRQRSATHDQRVGNRREHLSSRRFLRRIPCDYGARPSPDRVRPRPARGGLFQRDGGRGW